MEDYKVFLESAKEVARKAGALVQASFKSKHQVESKSKFDFVTEVDAASEKLISTYIKEKFPDHLIFGEEAVSSCPEGEEAAIDALPDDKFIWVVDPIDGTTNFIKGLPLFAICIAIVYNREVVVGVVNDISRDKLFYTAKGEKSYCNGEEIHVSTVDSFEKAIGVTSFPTNLTDRRKVLETLLAKGDDLLSLRIYNCAALAACSVAEGLSDFYVELGIHLWDFSAGKLLIENAGGHFCDVDGRPYHMHEKHVLAANDKLFEKLKKLLNE